LLKFVASNGLAKAHGSVLLCKSFDTIPFFSNTIKEPQPKQNLLILPADRQAIKFIIMKKIFFFTAITFLTLSSCRKEGATLAKDQAMAKSQSQTNASSSGDAFAFHDREIIDLAGEQFYNSCTDELMTASVWNLLIDFHGVYNGNKSTITFHVNLQRFKGVGEKSGLEYVGSGSFNEQESYFSDGVFTTKLVNHQRATTAGGDNNLTTVVTFYIKVDADGNVTIQRDPVEETYCQ
jgi:hypothetical protein